MKKLINILSKQTLQNLIAIRHFEPDEVIVLATDEYKYQAKDFEAYTQIPHTVIKVEAYNIENIFETINNIIKSLDIETELIINYTGGTKVLAVSVVLQTILRYNNPVLFAYVNTFESNIKMLSIDNDKKIQLSESEVNIKLQIEDSILLKGEKIKSYDNIATSQEEERRELSEELLTSKELERFFSKQPELFEKKGKKNELKPFYSDKCHQYEISYDANNLEVDITNGLYYKYAHHDGGKYLSGAWLEEYVFLKLYNSGKFDFVAKNMKFDFKKPKQKNELKNEIDVVVSNGLKSIFIECKAGKIIQDHIYKMHALKDYFLGTFGQSILVARFMPDANIIEKCKDLGIKIIAGKDIIKIDEMINKL